MAPVFAGTCRVQRVFECFLHLDKLLQFSLDFVQSSDVVPAHLGHLCTGLSESRWVALTQCPLREGMVGSGKGGIVL